MARPKKESETQSDIKGTLPVVFASEHGTHGPETISRWYKPSLPSITSFKTPSKASETVPKQQEKQQKNIKKRATTKPYSPKATTKVVALRTQSAAEP